MRRGVQGEIKIFFFGGNVERAIGCAECAFEADHSRQIEEQNIFAKFLNLADGKFGELRSFLPTVADLQFGMMGMIDPLIEKSIVGAARQFFNNGAQVFGGDTGVGVTFKIGFDAAAIEIYAELGTESVQHPTAFRIGEEVEHIIRRIVGAPDNGIDVVADAGDLTRAGVKLIQHGVATIFVGIEERFVIGGEAFVEPDVAPIFASDKVAEPLMRHFVRDQTLAVADVFGLIAK